MKYTKHRTNSLANIISLSILDVTFYTFTYMRMPTKKPIKKAVSTVENKAKAFASNFEKEAKVIKAESKEVGSKIWARRELSTTEEKMFTIIGIILLIWGIYQLKELVRWGILIVVGILFVTGFFIKRKK